MQEIKAADIQLFHMNQRYMFYRTSQRNPSFVVKSASTVRQDESGIASMRREFEMLSTLDIFGVVKPVSIVQSADALAMVMEDAGPRNLAARISTVPLSITEFWEVALQLVQTVGRIHSAGIIHLNLSPSNVVWNDESRAATLVDFGIAVSIAEVAVEKAESAQLPYSLSYISPEQTGRTGRSMDFRSDLYSLGATFYELLTGAPPFTAEDPIALIHAHLARLPTPPHLVGTHIPDVLSSIILKLLEKEPEQRYSSAEALLVDLQQASEQWSSTGTIVPFSLAEHYVPRHLSIPDKLYGRADEITALRDAFDRVGRSQRELLLVAGVPGVGKSALARQLDQYVGKCGGYFIAGKFDQLQRSVPYAGLVQAVRMLVRQLLAKQDSVVALWRERIAAAVAPNLQILIDLIPEIERIVGPQTPVALLGPVESKNRFNLVFTSFLNVLATSEHPFVLFLDDIQWIDLASLQLVQQWLAESTTGHLLIVGAYRDDEVDLAHPLARSLDELRRANVKITKIEVEALQRENVAELVRDTLDQDGDKSLDLAELLVRKTAGNPFFIKRLLHALYAEGLIRFSPSTRAWEWDIGQINLAPVTDNVPNLMAQAIRRLPEGAKKLVTTAACIGYRFDLATLAAVTEVSLDYAINLLSPALADGLLMPVREVDLTLGNPAADDPNHGRAEGMQFAHDRVQQAAYALLPEMRRCQLHLEIGRRLLEGASVEDLDGKIFEIVDQLDRGESLVVTPSERVRVAELNLVAGRKAKGAAAYGAAFKYLSAGRRLLPNGAWDELPELTFTIQRELAECAYLTGQHSDAEQLVETALEHASNKVAKADLYGVRVLAATVAGDWASALRWGREGLAVFGQEWPLEGLADANYAESLAVVTNVGEQGMEDLVGKPEVQDDETRACMRLLSILGPPAYFSGSEVLTFLVTRCTNLSLIHGPSVYSAYAYVFYGAIHNARTGQYDVGYGFGKLALSLARRFDDRAEESRTLEVFGLVVHVWCAHVRDSLPLMKEGHRAGVESGELAYAAFNLCGILINGLPAGVPLGELLADSNAAIEFADKHQNRTAVEISAPFRQFVLALTGNTILPSRFDDGIFSEARFLDDAKGNQTAIGQYWVAQLHAAYLFGDEEAARLSAQEAAKCISTGILGMTTTAEYTFYAALTMAAGYVSAAKERQLVIIGEVRSALAKLGAWATHCPANFLAKHKMVEAELERMAGSRWRAMELFGEAIDEAQQSGFVHEVALANELAAKLFLAHDQPLLANVYLRTAIGCYQQWGATAKAKALEEVQSGHMVSLIDEARVGPAPSSKAMHALDALAIIKASQAIAAENVPESLFERILQIVIEVSGAQTGALLLGDLEALRTRGRITIKGGGNFTLENQALGDSTGLPRAIVRYVTRTREPLVLDDAANIGPFAGDGDVQRLGLRSLLCVPLKKDTRVVGVLYLENNAMTSVFTEGRVEVVQALAAQAAISLENSTLLFERDHAERDLRALANDLTTENRRKTEFLATLAHELRNPLAPIRTGLDLLVLSQNNPSTTARVHEMMGRQLRQMVHLIDDLLDVARINSGKVQLKKARIELRDAISSAVEAALPSITAAQHTLDISIPDSPLMLDADPTRIAQVLSNLLTNATKYTPRGGRITVSVQNEEHAVNIAITDTGIGIPAHALAEVFDMFSQVSKTMGRSQGGLGIGLSLVRSLVQMHGGLVHAASAGEGMGSTFTVRLPLALQARQDGQNSVRSEAETHAVFEKKLNVLVADDNVDAAKMMMALLQACGHDVELVHDGRHAVEAAKATQYDLAILDIGMPGLSGYDVAQEIRQIPRHKHTFLAALTGWGAAEDRSRSKAAGFDAHLIKPAGILEINQLLRASVGPR